MIRQKREQLCGRNSGREVALIGTSNSNKDCQSSRLIASRSQGSYTDHILSPEANRAKYDFWLSKIRPRITDPKKRELLAPLEPPYYIHTKRPSLEQDYYESCDKPHVEITNSPIKSFTETGIQTEEKHTEFDIVAICTGYDAVTGGLRRMGIKSRDGVDLDDEWKDGVGTNVRMIVNGYPNLFMVYGPQGEFEAPDEESI